MKNLKLIIAGISLISVIVSCSTSEEDNNKNNKVCYKCVQNITVKHDGLTIGGSARETEFCNKTKSEIEKLQQDGTYVKTDGEVSETATFKCELKK